MRRDLTGAALGALAAALVFPLGSAIAQTGTSTAQAGGLEDIVVTAQRRAERLQDVPIAVTALTSQAIENAGVKGTDALPLVTPGLIIPKIAINATPFLRGVGSASGLPGDDPSVSFYVDGVYLVSASALFFDFNNIERIEVLKGPQGTLFGRNATGGLIQIITKDPEQQFAADADFGYGNYDTVTSNAYVNAPLGEKAAANIAVHYSVQNEGWGRNVFSGADVNKEKSFGIRGKLLLEPGDTTHLLFAGDYNKSQGDTGVARHALPGTILLNGLPFPAGFYDTNQDLASSNNVRQYGGSLRATQELAFADFVSISAYRRNRFIQFQDQDGTPLPLSNLFYTERARTFTQEIQLLSKPGSPVSWILGGFYLNSRTTYDLTVINRFLLNTALDTKSYAAFAQGTVPLGESTNFTAGLRYTSENKTREGQQFSPAGVLLVPNTPLKTKYEKLTWRFALDHKLNEDVMVYGTISRGFKAGQFNLTNLNNLPVKPETLDAYEIGIKSDLLGRTLRVNASAYYYDYKNIQLSKVESGVGLTFNASSAKIKGIDLEVISSPIEGLTIRVAGSYIDGNYGNFPSAPAGIPRPTGGNQTASVDATGNNIVRTPKFSFNTGVDYRMPISSGALLFSANYYYNGGFYWEADNRLKQKRYGLLNGQIGWAAEDDRFSAKLWGKNLTNKKYFIYENSGQVGDQGAPAAPRTYGVTLGFKM